MVYNMFVSLMDLERGTHFIAKKNIHRIKLMLDIGGYLPSFIEMTFKLENDPRGTSRLSEDGKWSLVRSCLVVA